MVSNNLIASSNPFAVVYVCKLVTSLLSLNKIWGVYMRKKFCLGVFLMLISLHMQAAERINWNDLSINWMSYEQGMQEIARTGKKGILVLYADWCPTCRAYSKLFSHPDIVSSAKSLVLMRANVDQYKALSRKMSFDGEYVPRTIALSANGKVMHELYPKTGKYLYYIPHGRLDYLMQFMRKVSIGIQ